MRIALGADHAGYEQKQAIVEALSLLGHETIDLGPHSTDSVDYPEYAKLVGNAVARGTADRGILVCGTGIGMALTAGKIPGVRASVITTPEFARLARQHNDLNVLCLSGRFVAPELNQQIVAAFLETEFEAGRHARRVAMIEQES